MSDPRRDRRLLTTDPTRAHQGPQNDGPFDLPDHPDAWDRRAHLRRDAHILDVGEGADGSQTFELAPPTTPGAPGASPSRDRTPRERSDEDEQKDSPPLSGAPLFTPRPGGATRSVSWC